MAKKRPHVPVRWIRKLHKQQGGICGRPGCKTPVTIGPRGQRADCILEHLIPRGLGGRGRDLFRNLALYCRACAARKTNRPKSGGAGGDIFEVRKTSRMRKMRVEKKWIPHRRTPLPKRPWPKGRKLQSRPFEKAERK